MNKPAAIFIVLLLNLNHITVWAQIPYDQTVLPNEIQGFIGTLREQLYSDTLKFNRSDLIHNSLGTINRNGNSPLFIINGKFYYKLDIISGDKVQEFINEFLDHKKIETISILDSPQSKALYGTYGSTGTVSIQLKKKVKFNAAVAGLNQQTNNNFFQRMPNELLIREKIPLEVGPK